jgi:hypothetical protein
MRNHADHAVNGWDRDQGVALAPGSNGRAIRLSLTNASIPSILFLDFSLSNSMFPVAM